MVRFKMLGRDINSLPIHLTDHSETQAGYRTWIVNGVPDLAGIHYTGLKSGENKLIDIVAYLIPNSGIFDFNFPDAKTWGISQQIYMILK